MRTVEYNGEECKVVAIGKENILIEYKDGWILTTDILSEVIKTLSREGIDFKKLQFNLNKRYWFLNKRNFKNINRLELE